MGNCNEYTPQSQFVYNNTNWELITENHYSVIMKSYANPKIQLQKWFSDKIQKSVIYSWRSTNQQQGFCKIERIGEESYYIGGHRQKEKRRSYVITQILTPLSQIQPITTSECILLLKVILPALKLLCEKFGWFQISTENIFLNSQGKPSVWIHPNIASNSPQKHYGASIMTQQSFIASVISVLRKKLQKYQKIQIPLNNLNFRSMQSWLQNQVKIKYPKLNKIYKNRGEFQLSDERRRYKESTKVTVNDMLIRQSRTINTIKVSTSPMKKVQADYSSNINLKTEERTSTSNAKYMSSVKDPDQLLFEMLRDYDEESNQ